MAAPDAAVGAASVRRRISGKSATASGPAAEGLGAEGLPNAAGQGGLSSSRLTIDEVRKLIPHSYGVCLHKPTQRFQAAPKKLGGGGSKFLGRFNTFEEATEAVCKFVVENGIDPRSLGTRKRHEGAAPAPAAPPAVLEVQADAASAVQAVDSAQDGAVANGTTSGSRQCTLDDLEEAPAHWPANVYPLAGADGGESLPQGWRVAMAVRESGRKRCWVDPEGNVCWARKKLDEAVSGPTPPKHRRSGEGMTAVPEPEETKAVVPLAQLAFFEALDQFKHVEELPNLATASPRSQPQVEAASRASSVAAPAAQAAAASPPRSKAATAAALAPNDMAAGARQPSAPAKSVAPSAEAAVVGPAPPPGAAGACELSASVSCAASAAEAGHEALQQPLATRGSFLDRLDSLSSLGFARCPRSS